MHSGALLSFAEADVLLLLQILWTLCESLMTLCLVSSIYYNHSSVLSAHLYLLIHGPTHLNAVLVLDISVINPVLKSVFAGVVIHDCIIWDDPNSNCIPYSYT